MDSLTQIVLGGAVGEAVLGKKVGNKAILWGAIGGTIPDLDTIPGLFLDTVSRLEIHRGFSHSIVFAILIAPLLGFLIDKIYRKKKESTWWGWTQLMFWAIFTHPLLDIFTTWGTQLLWPLEWRIAIQSIFVIDPLYTLPFLICLIAVLFIKRKNPKRMKWNRLGLVISSFYLLITVGIKLYVDEVFEEEFNWDEILKKKLFLSHGEHDMVIPFESGEKITEFYSNNNMAYENMTFSGGHEIPLSLFKKMKSWFVEVAND